MSSKPFDLNDPNKGWSDADDRAAMIAGVELANDVLRMVFDKIDLHPALRAEACLAFLIAQMHAFEPAPSEAENEERIATLKAWMKERLEQYDVAVRELMVKGSRVVMNQGPRGKT